MFTYNYNIIIHFVRRYIFILFVFFVATSCAKGYSEKLSLKHRSSISVAEQLIANGEYENGYMMLDQVSAAHKDSWAVQLQLADSYFKQNAYMKANKHYAIAAKVGHPLKGYLGLGRVSLALNKPDIALQYFNSALRHTQDRSSALNGIGVSYDLFGRHSDAQKVYKEILAHDSSHIGAYNNFALSLALSGEADTAQYMLKQLLSSHLNNDVVRQNLALVLTINGHPKEALELASVDMSKEDFKHNQKVIEQTFGISLNLE